MKPKQLLLTCLFAGAFATNANAQEEYYDITDYYLENPTFSASFDYDKDATGDVKNTVKDMSGWTLDNATQKSNAIGATFQYGTAATFYDAAIPATDPDGQSTGGCLALAASFAYQVTYYQNVKLPVGKYLLVVNYRNCNPEADGGSSTTGWWVSSSAVATSSLTTFTYGEWKTDSISFELTELTAGQIKVGFKSTTGLPKKTAMLAIDRVKLLRDTPYGDIDDYEQPPVVVTDTRYARGATMAFGRIKSVKAESVAERGFCWSENPEPTINDHKTTETLSGTIYVLNDLTPATKYYMRAYAKTETGKVGYGDVIKFYTIPKGKVTVSWNNGGDTEINNRMNAAVKQAADIFNALTSINKGFGVGYSPGTPTADCAYNDSPWINMGSNASYQRTGTIMHEMQHGLGVISYSTHWSGNILRAGEGSGDWLGDRVSAFLDFWDNTTGSHLHGDTQHMWPYGVNGASEDNGKLETYYANAMIGQALGEDGLQHNSKTFAEPYYAFDQEDNIKYYIKSESETYGRNTGFLIPHANGQLFWHEMTPEEAVMNDSTAWYITFTPENQYYQFRNAATGQYLTYSVGFKTLNRTKLTANDNLHLMKGRVDVPFGDTNKRGYWIIHPTNDLSPKALLAKAIGYTSNETFNISNDAVAQRWLILTAAEMGVQEVEGIKTVTNSQQPAANCYYDLQGRKVANGQKPTAKGLYIINGQKVILK